MEIDCLQRNKTFKFKITLNRHNARHNINYCILPEPTHFSLPSTINASLCWLKNVVGMYLDQVHLLLIGQRGLGHFIRYWPLLPIGWRIVQILRQHGKKTTSIAPTNLSAIQAASQSTLSMYNYTPLVISRNEQNKQLTLLRKLALTAINKIFAL
jgi:hypothetical protein